jgi:hypothetical protein
MVIGGAVRCGNYTGFIRAVVRCRPGVTLGGTNGPDQVPEQVMVLYVQPVGVQHAWPVAAERVDSINGLVAGVRPGQNSIVKAPEQEAGFVYGTL